VRIGRTPARVPGTEWQYRVRRSQVHFRMRSFKGKTGEPARMCVGAAIRYTSAHRHGDRRGSARHVEACLVDRDPDRVQVRVQRRARGVVSTHRPSTTTSPSTGSRDTPVTCRPARRTRRLHPGQIVCPGRLPGNKDYTALCSRRLRKTHEIPRNSSGPVEHA
jgi:hypothetical protein